MNIDYEQLDETESDEDYDERYDEQEEIREFLADLLHAIIIYDILMRQGHNHAAPYNNR